MTDTFYSVRPDLLGFDDRFCVGEILAAQHHYVFDAQEQHDALPGKVKLWCIETKRMGNHGRGFIEKLVATNYGFSEKIEQYLKDCDTPRAIVERALKERVGIQKQAQQQAQRERFMTLWQDSLDTVFSIDKYVGNTVPTIRELMKSARTHPVINKEATASAFAQWVYSLFHHDYSKYAQWLGLPQKQRIDSRMELGSFFHKDIEQFRQWIHWKYPFSIGNQWRLAFADTNQEPRQVFYASGLQVNGKPLACIPDVVLRNQMTGDVIIIERKMTFVDESKVPEMGWANLRAQLWCYSWIDDWRDAPKMYLFGQFWEAPSEYIFAPRLMGKHPRWRRDDPVFQATGRALFELYGGTVKSR